MARPLELKRWLPARPTRRQRNLTRARRALGAERGHRLWTRRHEQLVFFIETAESVLANGAKLTTIHRREIVRYHQWQAQRFSDRFCAADQVDRRAHHGEIQTIS